MLTHGYQSPWINVEIDIFRKSTRALIHERYAPHQPLWRKQQHPDAEAWREAGRAGILLADVPEEYGGGGGTFAHQAVVLEELAKANIHFGSIIQSIVAHYILAYGREDQKHKWLPQMARGEIVGAIALSEPSAGSDLTNIQTTARRDSDQYVINGSKAFVTNGTQAEIICLAAKTNTSGAPIKGISLIIVETKNLLGYHAGHPFEKIGMNAQDVCEVSFDNVVIPLSNILGNVEGEGFSQVVEQLSYERLAVAVTAVATAERAVSLTTQYVKERMAFGKPLIEFQNTRFKLAECKTEAHIGRVFLDSCIARMLEGKLDPVTAAMAKYWLTECQCRIVDECLQLHGGYGYMMEYPIARLWADSRVQRIYAGTNEIMKEFIAWSL